MDIQNFIEDSDITLIINKNLCSELSVPTFVHNYRIKVNTV